MATRTLKARIEIDGEAKYKEALRGLSQANAVLTSELKELDAKFTHCGKGAEYFSEKGRILDGQLDNQNAKVVLLREALEKAESQYGKNSTVAREWAIELNNAEAGQWKLLTAIEKNSEELAKYSNNVSDAVDKTKDLSDNASDAVDKTNDLGSKASTVSTELTDYGKTAEHAASNLDDFATSANKAQKETMSLGDSLSPVLSKFGIDLPESIQNSLNGLDGFSVEVVEKLTAAAGTVMAVYEAGKAVVDLTVEAARHADDVLKRSEATNIDVETIQSMDYASLFGKFDEYTKIMEDFAGAVQTANAGGSEMKSIFSELGVSFESTDGKLRPLRDVFADVIKAFEDYPESERKAEIANALFGENYENLMSGNNSALQRWIEKMQEAGREGITMGEDSIKSLSDTNEKIVAMGAKWDAFKEHLAVVVAPAVSAVLGGMTAGIDELGKWLDAATEKWRAFWNWVDEHTIELNDSVGYYVDSYNPAFAGAPGNNAAGTDYWRGGLTWIGESGPELVELPRGAKVYSNQESERLSDTSNSRLESLLSQNLEVMKEIKRTIETMPGDMQAVYRMI